MAESLIRFQYYLNWGGPSTLGALNFWLERPVTMGSKALTGNDGYADISLYSDDRNTIWIWEVKKSTIPNAAARARSEADWYVKIIRAESRGQATVDLGFTFDRTGSGGAATNVRSAGAGAVLYDTRSRTTPNPPALPQFDPRLVPWILLIGILAAAAKGAQTPGLGTA